MPKLVRVTINGNPYRVPEGGPVTQKDIRRRLAGKIGFGKLKLKGLDKAKVEYRRFLQRYGEWKAIPRGLLFESGMSFRCLVIVRRNRGCRIVKGPRGGIAFVCRRGG